MCRKSFAMLWSNPRCQVCRFRGEDDECFRGMWGGHTSGVCVCVCVCVSPNPGCQSPPGFLFILYIYHFITVCFQYGIPGQP